MSDYLHTPGCGDCGYGCCCKCNDPTCTVCKHTGCDGTLGSDAYICFQCRRKWTRGLYTERDFVTYYNNLHRLGAEKKKLEARLYDKPCPYCNREAIEVSAVVRPPPSRDDKAWELLEKLQRGDGLTFEQGTLSKLWKGIGCTLHMHPYYKKSLAAPKTLREYPQWVEYMNNTHYNWDYKNDRLYLRSKDKSRWYIVR